MAGLTAGPNGSAAYVMQFAPGKLRQFQLVYQNALYRVFRRTDQPEPFDPRNSRISRYMTRAISGRTDRRVFIGRGHRIRPPGAAAGQRIVATRRRLFAAGRWPEAYGLYREALAHCPSLPYAHSHIARILLEAGRVSEALVEADQAVRADPFEPEGWFHLALILAKLGDRVAARRALEECRRIDPAFPGLARHRGGAEIKSALKSSTHRYDGSKARFARGRGTLAHSGIRSGGHAMQISAWDHPSRVARLAAVSSLVLLAIPLPTSARLPTSASIGGNPRGGGPGDGPGP